MKALALALLCLLVGCSSGGSTCIAGQSLACAGPGGCAGFQVCAADGKSVGACQCGSSSSSGSSSSPGGTTTGTSTSSSSFGSTTATTGSSSSGSTSVSSGGGSTSSGSSSTADCGTPSGSYSGTCTGCSLSTDCEYSCTCANDDDGPQTSTVQLPCDAGLANCNGLLNCEDLPEGSYLGSCTGCVVNGGGCELDCNCPGAGTLPAPTSLALPCAEAVSNCDGILTCETPPDAGNYLQSCTGCSVTNCTLSCASCQGGSAAPAPLTLPCDAGIFDCSDVLTCATPPSTACPTTCSANAIIPVGSSTCNISCSCPDAATGIQTTVLPYPCSAGYSDCGGQVVCGPC